MRIAITGSTGLLGRALVEQCRNQGHLVTRLVRHAPAQLDEVRWDPEAGTIDTKGLEGHDAIVHLAGESIGQGRWTDAKKQRIRDSRVKGTRLVAETVARLDSPPSVVLSASAVGYYGDRGEEVLDESSARGAGFLADVCEAWEEALEPTRARTRVVSARMGVVFSPQGGALERMLTPFRFGVGGRLGSGSQYMSWITVEDAVRAYLFLLATPTVEGPVNVTSPQPVTNQALTKALGRVLGRPTVATVPAFAARLLLGEMADALLLSSARVLPRKLTDAGFVFQDGELEPALHKLLGPKPVAQAEHRPPAPPPPPAPPA